MERTLKEQARIEHLNCHISGQVWSFRQQIWSFRTSPQRRDFLDCMHPASTEIGACGLPGRLAMRPCIRPTQRDDAPFDACSEPGSHRPLQAPALRGP